ncbi:MAG: nuclear transport factor 2 family protein [Acidimicrobiia bacterium]
MAIHQLFVDYGEHLDAGDFEAYSQLFAEDGEVLLGPMGRAKGRSEIKALMVSELASTVGSTMHIISSPRVTLDGDTATSTVMWTVVGIGADGAPRVPMVGHHIDTLTRTTEGWRIQRRKGVMNLPATFVER